ncbi:MAG: phosphoribosyltransferase family protein [Umezawaea sp.]
MKTGPLDMAIKQHKYGGKWGWGVIFARVLLGHLARDRELAAADLIIPMPSVPLAPGVPRAGNDHSGWIIESAMHQDDVGYRFRLEPPVLVKTAPTDKMASTRSLAERTAVAADLYRVLEVRDPASVLGRTVVVVDDVFTTGSTLDAVARRLREAGAARVLGLTLARQPWNR